MIVGFSLNTSLHVVALQDSSSHLVRGHPVCILTPPSPFKLILATVITPPCLSVCLQPPRAVSYASFFSLSLIYQHYLDINSSTPWFRLVHRYMLFNVVLILIPSLIQKIAFSSLSSRCCLIPHIFTYYLS